MNQLVFNPKPYTYIPMKWEELLGGTAMGTLISELGHYLRARKKQKALPTVSIPKLNEIYSRVMKPTLDHTSADRFIIFKAEDSGGSIAPGAQLYSSILYEDYVKGKAGLIDQYQRWRADKQLIELLMRVCMEGQVCFEVDALDVEGKMRTMLKSQNVSYAEIHFIAQTRLNMFYALVATSNSLSNFSSPSNRAQIDLSIDHLRNIFKDYIKFIK